MAERILDDEYRSEDLAFGVSNYRYQLKYDPETGKYKVESTGLIPGTDILSIKLFEDGQWLLDATQNPNLFEDGDVNRPTQLAIELNEDIRRKVNAAHKTIGGNAAGYKIHPSATPDRFNDPIVTSGAQQPQEDPEVDQSGLGLDLPQIPGVPVGITSSLQNISDIVGNLSDTIKQVAKLAKLEPEEIEKYLKFGAVDENTIKGTKEKYPIDALYGKNGQDYILISQFKYQPPRRDLLFSDKPLKVLTEGFERSSAFKLEEQIGFVKLPMPNDISDSNNVDWGKDAMNNLSAAITGAVLQDPTKYGGFALGGGIAGGLLGVPGVAQAGLLVALVNEARKQGLQMNGAGNALVGSNVASRILSMAQVNVSPESILARGFGVAPNSNMELLFNAPTLREFQFNWKLSPRSEQEARSIRKIIRFFKQGMAAKKLDGTAGAASFFLGTPNIFRLQYKTKNDADIPGLNRIKTCALTGTSVNYTPDGEWASYDEGQPVSTVISLRFQELEPIYDTDYQRDVTDGRVDLYSVKNNEVGY